MCRRPSPYLLLFVVLLVAAASVSAETLAVSVRLIAGPEDEPGVIRLLASMEEGAMETMFARGHIVFDINVEGATDSSRQQAIEIARAGGATTLVLIDVVYELVSSRGLMPTETHITVVDLDSGRDRQAESVEPGLQAGADKLSLDVVALNVGTRAAENALLKMEEVAPW